MASRFWVGGTGTWDASTTTHWASSTGGAGGQTAPTSADAVTFDGASGGGTVTPSFGGSATFQSITFGAFTGTIDFSANNDSITLTATVALSGTGTGARTFNMGNGTWTLSSVTTGNIIDFTTPTSLTFNANNSLVSITGTAVNNTRTIVTGAKNFHDLTVSGGAVATSGSAVSWNTITLTGPARLLLGNGVTHTVTTLTTSGSAASPIMVASDAQSAVATLSIASGTPTLNWAGIRRLTCTGGATFVGTNSLDLGGNSGITITGPITGGSGVIGG